MKRSQARGYLLEVVLEKLIKVNGYDVISQHNGDDIIRRHNGLNVKGRGGYHQFDSLGEFKITPPFMYPLRLFVEAKFYTGNRKVQVERVRMGIGVLQDVNANYATVTMSYDELNLTKYDYHYALFSTSGFTEDSQRLALAHKVSLIDLSNGQLFDIKRIIENIVDLLAYRRHYGLRDDIPNSVFNRFRDSFRNFINNDRYEYFGEFCKQIDELIEEIRNRSIYLASIRSSQIIALIPDDDHAFRRSLRQNPHQQVSITWDRLDGDWVIIPENGSYRLTFKLPELFIKELSNNLEQLESRTMNMKETMFATMSFIAYLDDQNPTICTLKFSRKRTLELIKQTERERERF